MNNIVGKVGFEPTIAFANRFTVCHFKPLSHFPIKKMITHYGNRTRRIAVKGQCVNRYTKRAIFDENNRIRTCIT